MSSLEGEDATPPVNLAKPGLTPGSNPGGADPAPPPTYVLSGRRTGLIQPGLGIGRIIGLVLASLLALFSLGIISAGAVLAWVHESRGADGFLSTSNQSLSTSTAALTSSKVAINVGGISWFTDHLGTIRITATSTDGKPIFVGIAPRADVNAWLGVVSVDQIQDLQFEPFSVTVKRLPGSVGSLKPPGAQTFWTARGSGTTTQILNWKVTSGDWAVVVANADGSPGVAITARFGAKFSWLGPLSLTVIIVGVVLFIVAIVIVILLLRSRGRREWTAAQPTAANQPLP